MKEKDNFDKAVILSGDGDFLPVLKYLKKRNKEMKGIAMSFNIGDGSRIVRLK